MSESSNEQVTAILDAWQKGDREAFDRLVPLVYQELRKIARAHLRSEPAGHSLQATAVVHEAYLRLFAMNRLSLRSRAHLLALAARLMRQVLVDHARRKRAAKRGGAVTMLSLDDLSSPATAPVADVLAVDQALGELMSVDARLCRVVELRFFAGMSVEEAAEVLDTSAATVKRDWAMAKAWLFQRLTPLAR